MVDLKAFMLGAFQQMIIEGKENLDLKFNSSRAHAPVGRVPGFNLKRASLPVEGGRKIVVIEENPYKDTTWGNAALAGNKVMQVADSAGRYIGVVVNGQAFRYGGQDGDPDVFLSKATGEKSQ